MFEIRTFRVGDRSYIVALRGELDLDAATEVAAEIEVRRDGQVVVDLLRAQVGDLDALDLLVSAAGADTTFVAERPALDALDVVGLRRYVNTAPTLVAALA